MMGRSPNARPSVAHHMAQLAAHGQRASTASQYIRNRADLPEQLEVLMQCPVDDPVTQEYLTGVCSAKNWSEVWRPRTACDIANTQKALNWFVALAERHADSIRAHIVSRKALVTAALQGRWTEVLDMAQGHTKRFGPTLWVLNWSMLYAEETGGSSARAKLIELLRDLDRGAPVAARFASCFGLSADVGLPDEAFRHAAKDWVRTDDPTLKQYFELLTLDDLTGDWKTWQLMACSECFPLIDRYELFYRLAAIGFAMDHREAPILRRTIIRLSRSFEDPCLQYLAACVENEEAFTPDHESRSLQEAWDAYLESDYDKCYSVSRSLAQSSPDVAQVHELVVKSAMFLGRTEELKGSSPIALLWHHMRNVLSKNEHAEDSLAFLLRFGTRFRVFSLSWPLRAVHSQHCAASPDDALQRRASFAMTLHGPRNFEYGHPVTVTLNYLRKCALAFPDSSGVRLFASLVRGESPEAIIGCDQIPAIRRQFFGGLAALRRREFREASQRLGAFLEMQKGDSANPLAPYAIEEARRAAVNIYRVCGDVVGMQREVVRAYIQRMHSVRRLPLAEILAACNESRSQACRHIEYPIVVYLASDDPQEVSIAVRAFMRSIGVKLPRDIAGSPGVDREALAILYLRVCTPEVLDSFPSLETVAKVESERLWLLNWVKEEVPSFSRVVENEVLRLTQHAQLREALAKIEGARIVVNVAGLREAEHDRFADSYYKYVAQRELAAAQTQEDLLSAIRKIEPRSSGVLVINAEAWLERTGTGATAFMSVFREIRDCFVMSPHFGIEACLSGRIRHGILIQHIRRPFVARKLALRSDSNERMQVEKVWSERLQVDAAVFNDVMGILQRMTEEIDSVAQEVRGGWIQSRTETKNPVGMFDYAFTDETLRGVHRTEILGAPTKEIFLDRVFDVLLERTRNSLNAVRDRISQELRARLASIIDRAITQLAPFGDALYPLRNELAHGRNDADRMCQQMVGWFTVSDATLMGDAEFLLVARTAVGMIERLNPDFRGRHDVDKSSDCIVRGRYFTALVHILFYLLDNAVRHSDVSHAQYAGKVVTSVERGQVCIGVRSVMSSPLACEAAASRIHERIVALRASLDPDKVVREGGSGFAKIIAIVRYEFKQYDPIVDAIAEGAYLSVSLTCAAADLVECKSS